MNNSQTYLFPILNIFRGTTVDGPGLRTSIYIAGCAHHCKGCHNPQSWDISNGVLMSLDEIMSIVIEENFNVTITGGDPLFNPQALSILTRALKNNRRNIWIYTGYTFEEILQSPVLLQSIKDADVLVDGKYIENLRNPDSPFRGSSNQRIINISASISQKRAIPFIF